MRYRKTETDHQSNPITQALRIVTRALTAQVALTAGHAPATDAMMPIGPQQASAHGLLLRSAPSSPVPAPQAPFTPLTRTQRTLTQVASAPQADNEVKRCADIEGSDTAFWAAFGNITDFGTYFGLEGRGGYKPVSFNAMVEPGARSEDDPELHCLTGQNNRPKILVELQGFKDGCIDVGDFGNWGTNITTGASTSARGWSSLVNATKEDVRLNSAWLAAAVISTVQSGQFSVKSRLERHELQCADNGPPPAQTKLSDAAITLYQGGKAWNIQTSTISALCYGWHLDPTKFWPQTVEKAFVRLLTYHNASYDVFGQGDPGVGFYALTGLEPGREELTGTPADLLQALVGYAGRAMVLATHTRASFENQTAFRSCTPEAQNANVTGFVRNGDYEVRFLTPDVMGYRERPDGPLSSSLLHRNKPYVFESYKNDTVNVIDPAFKRVKLFANGSTNIVEDGGGISLPLNVAAAMFQYVIAADGEA